MRRVIRRVIIVAMWAVVGAAVLLLLAAVALAVAFANGGLFGDRYEPEPPAHEVFAVLLPGDRFGGEQVELVLDPRDVEALGLEGRFIEDPGYEISLLTAVLVDETPGAGYCLVGAGAVTNVTTGAVVATIPAGTCLGPNALTVPWALDSAIAADPERWDVDPGPGAVALAGTLVVGIDGCTSMDGTRLIWPDDTTIDEAGTIELPDGRSFDNGAVVTLAVVRDPNEGLRPDLWCAPGAAVASVAVAR